MSNKLYDDEILQKIKDIDLIEYMNSQGIHTLRTGTNSFKATTCPICNGGDHFVINIDTNRYKSFNPTCTITKSNGSIIDFVQEYDNLDWKDAIKKLKDYAGIEGSSNTFSFTGPKAKDVQKDNNAQLLTKAYDFKELVDKVYEGNRDVTYFNKRGLNKTISKYKLMRIDDGINGFLKDYPELHIDSFNNVYIYFIPIIDENNKIISFVIRAEDSIREALIKRYSADNPKFKLEKNHNLIGLKMPIFNARYLKDILSLNNTEDRRIYVCEGIFDALSIEEEGKNAISINSINMYNKFLDLIKENMDIAKEFEFKLCGDSDDEGKFMNKMIKEGLNELNIKNSIIDIPKPYHDINELYVRNKELFIPTLDNIILEPSLTELAIDSDVKEEFANKSSKLATSSNFHIENNLIKSSADIIMNDILAEGLDISSFSTYTEIEQEIIHPLKLEAMSLRERALYARNNKKDKSFLFTVGFRDLDKILKYSSRKIIGLGAIPGVGKTTLCINMAINLAKQKKHSLFYSLELDGTFVMAKILSMISKTLKGSNHFLDAESIYYYIMDQMDTFNSIEEEDALLEIIDYYDKNLAQYIHIDDFINREEFSIANRTIEAITVHTKDFIKKYKTIPILFIDYVQQVESENKNLINDKQRIDYIASKLIEMKKLLGVTVFLISSLNRDSYLESITETSFKESGALEYCADLLLGLQWRDMQGMIQRARADKEYNLKDEINKLKYSSEKVKKLECIVVKNRNGVAGGTVNLDFYGEYHLFTDADNSPDKPLIETPSVAPIQKSAVDNFV